VQSSFVASRDGSGASCPSRGFTPDFMSGLDAQAPLGGGSSPFSLFVSRGDDDQEFSGVSVDMPEGLLARIGDVPVCADAQAAAGTCGEQSRIGSVTTGAGAGETPFQLPGRVYLTGPYKGAPFGLSVVVPAIAGPVDLGTVVVRAAIEVDPETAAVSVVSDPLPTILEGIPLQIRTIHLKVDRSGFMVNPTDCSEARVGGKLTSTTGAVASVGSRFQVGECAALDFEPKLAMRLTGRSQRFRQGHPGLRAVVRQPAGQANIGRVRVTMPREVVLDPKRTGPDRVCSFEDGQKADCPKSTKIGSAVANTPILDEPLRGAVYLVQGIRVDKRTGVRRRTLPTLLVKLRGEVAINLRARTTAIGGRLVSTFASVPDAPISKFTLRLASGRRGILINNQGICGRALSADVEMLGQNGKSHDFGTKLPAPCPKSGARRR
jgi:hypothetical protein